MLRRFASALMCRLRRLRAQRRAERARNNQGRQKAEMMSHKSVSMIE
jgi:hypothetical protein